MERERGSRTPSSRASIKKNEAAAAAIGREIERFLPFPQFVSSRGVDTGSELVLLSWDSEKGSRRLLVLFEDEKESKRTCLVREWGGLGLGSAAAAAAAVVAVASTSRSMNREQKNDFVFSTSSPSSSCGPIASPFATCS